MIIEAKPDYTLNNKKLWQVLENLCSYKYILSRIDIKNKKIKKQTQYGYEILISKDKVGFYYLCEDDNIENLKTELEVAYPKATFIQKPKIGTDADGNIVNNDHMINVEDMLELGYDGNSFLSLKTDFRTEQPLTSLLDTRGILRGNEKVLIQYLITPCEPSIKDSFAEYIANFRKDKVVRPKSYLESEKLLQGVSKVGYEGIAEALDTISLLLTDEEYKKENLEELLSNLQVGKSLSSQTLNKPSLAVYNTSIRIGVEGGGNETRNEFLLKAFKNPFINIEGNNSLKVLKPWGKKEKLLQYFKNREPWDYFTKNVLSTKELHQLMMLPTKTNQVNHHLDCIDTREPDVPKEFLGNKGLKVCKVTVKGKTSDVYLPLDDADSICQCYVGVGQMGTGKTTQAEKSAIQWITNGISVFAVDVADGTMVDNIVNGLPLENREKVKILDFGDIDNPIPLGWNESSKGNSRKYTAQLSSQLKNFLNKLADVPMGTLTSRMEKFLGAAAKAVFVNPECGLYDVIMCLTNGEFRKNIIEKHKVVGRTKYILDQLNDDKDPSGTNMGYIKGIMDRIDSLLDNEFVSNCLLQAPCKEVNFREWADNGYFVGIKIPKSTLLDDGTDLLVTFIVSKLWLAILSREDIVSETKTPCILILDEPHQFPTVFKELYSIIREMRKWRLGVFILMHEFGDLKQLKPVLKAAGTNYFLYKTSKETYKELLEEFSPFELEELLDVKWRHAYMLLRYKSSVLKIMGNMNGKTPFVEEYKQVNEYGRPVEIVEQEILDKMIN